VSVTASEARKRLFPLIEQVNDDQVAIDLASILTTPNTPASNSSRRVRRRSLGRHTASNTMLADTKRSKTAPPGPSRSNSVAASAEPN
jgi:hypothetical protein